MEVGTTVIKKEVTLEPGGASLIQDWSSMKTRRAGVNENPDAHACACAMSLGIFDAQAQGPETVFTGKFGQVEVGGRYAGAEFHGSRPLPSRISFFYPVANSVDLSKDYWKRENHGRWWLVSKLMAAGIGLESKDGRTS